MLVRALTMFGVFALGGCEPSFDGGAVSEAVPRSTSAWPVYDGPGGRKFADLGLIDKTNVGDLELAWSYRTGDVGTVFQSTPILVEGQLVFCSPFNKVVALDPMTGGELWTFDPIVDRSMGPANEFNCRSVTAWHSPGSGSCNVRIFMATNDARLIVLDAATGLRCTTFGIEGEMDLADGVGELNWPGEYQVTSPPAVAGDLVIVGSAISDGNRVTAPSGVVRAFDARTGELAWAFDLAPPGIDRAKVPTSEHGYVLGTPNVWAPMSVDSTRDMVFLATGNPAPDYDRPDGIDMGYYGSAVVALRASTGELLWHFNTVIKDYWDFDVPSKPVLADLDIAGERVASVIQGTKMGHVFVLHRETGEPVVDVDYRKVPRHGPLEDKLSPVQPFPPTAFQVSRNYEMGSSLLGLCDELDAASVTGPVFTPITQEWTIGLPSNMGATNWGGVAVDEARGLIAVNANHVPFRTKLISRREASDLLDVMNDRSASPESRQTASRQFFERYDLPPDVELAPQHGTDHLMARHPYLDATLGIPCAGIPLAEMLVIDIERRIQTWRRPHGTPREIVKVPLNWGAPGMGGSLITETGLVFIGAAAENAVRAYDLDSGEELWHHRLPNPGNATPMSYVVSTPQGDRQYVVIAAGGDARSGIGGVGDTLVAFALDP